MSLETKVHLEVPATDLLSALWYSDGSGATEVGVSLTSLPQEWEVKSVYFNRETGIVEIGAKKREAAADGA